MSLRTALILIGVSGAMLGVSAGGGAQTAPKMRTSGWVENQLLDINTATRAELAALPGMGEVYAKRIIDGRPYTSMNPLVTCGIMEIVITILLHK